MKILLHLALLIPALAALADEARPPATHGLVDALIGHRDVWLPECQGFVSCPIYDRARLGPGHAIRGPAIVEQMDATTVILPEQTAVVDQHLSILITD